MPTPRSTLSLCLLIACAPAPLDQAPSCDAGACGTTLVEALKHPMQLQAPAFDVRGDRLLVPEVDGLAVHDLTRDGVPRLADWHHEVPLLSTAARFVSDDLAIVRTPDAVWWVRATADEVSPLGSVAVPAPEVRSDGLDPEEILASETRVVLLAPDTGFTVVDATDPSAPRLGGTVAASATESWGCLHDETLAVLQRTEIDPPSFDYVVELALYDLSDPDAPELVQVEEVDDTSPYSLSCDEARVVTTSHRELRSFLRAPDGTLTEAVAEDVVPIGQSPTTTVAPIWARVDGGRALVQQRTSGSRGTLHVLDLAALETGTPWDDALGAALHVEPNPYALIGDDGDGVLWANTDWESNGRGLERYRWSGPEVLREDGPTLELDGDLVSRVRVYGDLAVVGGAMPRLYDVSCPASPVEVTPANAAPWLGLDSALEVDGGVLVERNGGLELVSMARPLAPLVMDRLDGDSVHAAMGSRFVSLQASHVDLGRTDDGLSSAPLGCIPLEGDPVLGDHEPCAPVIGAALTTSRLVLMTFQDTVLVHVYALEDDGARWEGTIRQEEGAWCRLVSDGTHVALVDVDRVWPLDLDALAAGDAIVMPDDYLPVRLDDGVLSAAGQQLHRWSMPGGEALESVDIEAPPLDFVLRGEVFVGVGGAVTLATRDLTCR